MTARPPLSRVKGLQPSPAHRVVTLASLSSRVPTPFITERLALQLREETKQSVLLIQLTQKRDEPHAQLNPKSPRWGRNGRFRFAHLFQALSQGVTVLPLALGGSGNDTESLESIVRTCQTHFPYVLIHASNDISVETLLECFRLSERQFLFLQTHSADLYLRELLFRELRTRTLPFGSEMKSVFCRRKGESLTHPVLRELSSAGLRLIQGCPDSVTGNDSECGTDRLFKDDIRRLAREIGRCRLGLALSSGGARGLSHIGVLQVLEENHIEIDVVAGCSMGAYVGAVWSYGYDGRVMEKLAREVEHRWGILELIDPFLLPRRGFMGGQRVRRRLERSIGDIHFAELPRPLRIVATNLYTLERKVFTQGPVAEAVHASSAIPGACAPVTIGGESYIDGGICDPLPVDLLEDMGVERILAVNTIPTPAYLRCGEEMRREITSVKYGGLRRVRSFLNRHFNYFATGNILDTIFRSFHGAQIRVAEQSSRRADLVLRPLSLDGRWHDFRHPGKYIEIGRKEAEEHLAEITAWANGNPLNHEISSSDKSLATIA